MVHDPITVLVVADGAGDTHPAIQALAEADPPCVVVRAGALEPALDRLARGGIDLVLLDFALAYGLESVVRAAASVPVEVMSAPFEDKVSTAAYRHGAVNQMAVGPQQPDGLFRILREVQGRKRAGAALDRRLRLLREGSALLEGADDDGILERVARLMVSWFADVCVMVRLHPDGSLEQVHLAAADAEDENVLRALGDTHRGVTLAMPDAYLPVLLSRAPVILDLGDPELARQFFASNDAVSAYRRVDVRSTMLVPIVAGGTSTSVMILGVKGSPRRFVDEDAAAAEDLARRVALALEHARLVREAREMFEADLTGNFVATVDGTVTDCNPAFARMLGYDDEPDVLRRGATAIFGGESSWMGIAGGVARERRVRQHEIALRRSDGGAVHVLVSATGVFGDRGQLAAIRGQLYDLTAHKQLEEQLSQSQKMEAVGRLAGGIAHDFNNLLMVIGGQTGRLLEQLADDDPMRRNAEAIAAAADRAAGLTQQLLAFSRRQVLSPQVLSLNAVVRNIHDMLERVIGEDIHCVLSLSDDIASVKADPGRIEQALLNLAVNARDAMPEGGTLTISTSVVELDEIYSRQHVGSRPGRYVMLAVSDTGCGMDPETRTRVFEPFFTTKEVGKGTGLGLSMVYGIVKQSGGYIWVYSELGLGTSFKIYLPALQAVPEEIHARPVTSAPTGTETVLLVEDEDGVRELIEELLAGQGYTVMAASCGADALQMSELFEGEIQILVTDVVMPNMSGHELAMRLTARRPGLRVLYLSGYTDDAIAHHGVIELDAAFLQKPFTRAALATKIRDVLAGR